MHLAAEQVQKVVRERAGVLNSVRNVRLRSIVSRVAAQRVFMPVWMIKYVYLLYLFLFIQFTHFSYWNFVFVPSIIGILFSFFFYFTVIIIDLWELWRAVIRGGG